MDIDGQNSRFVVFVR